VALAVPRTLTFDSLFIVATIKMDITFDPRKDKANILKHGVSLAMARLLDWDAALVSVDDRFHYAECRMIALAPESRTVYYVAFVETPATRRIISLRPATRREVSHYVESIQ
jgi:uncharacterized DUF497 family protein